jgi:hypothetical protein
MRTTLTPDDDLARLLRRRARDLGVPSSDGISGFADPAPLCKATGFTESATAKARDVFPIVHPMGAPPP